MNRAIIFIFLLPLFTGCSKKQAGENDTIFPVIILNSPLNGQTFSPGQGIPITGTITDNQYIAEVHIHVSNDLTGALLMDVHLYPASASTSFNQAITASAGVSYKIQVIAKDRNVNESRTTAVVSCN